jgi:hypothetical protein
MRNLFFLTGTQMARLSYLIFHTRMREQRFLWLPPVIRSVFPEICASGSGHKKTLRSEVKSVVVSFVTSACGLWIPVDQSSAPGTFYRVTPVIGTFECLLWWLGQVVMWKS